ncbi:MAG TPA: hypothetical protein VGN18_16250 [Jatrophihabitans sp.]|uniref:hypothetical protein n=1 Tax=Jatrophihabitans sp. TaxID=1932789 RepID=UPI002E01162F|nr:hypothetical protein [Jatrophihabitans sp.]
MLTAVESGARASDGLEQRLAAIDGSAGHASQPRVGPHRAIGRRSPRWVPPLLAAAVLAVIAGGAAVVSTVAADHSRPATRPPTLTPTPTPVPTPITTPAPRPSTAVTTARTTSSTTAPTGSPTSASSSPAGSRTAAVTLGPLGFGTLKLGMNAQQARLTGEISSLTDIPGGCSRFDLKAITTRPAGGIDGYIDLKYGVVFIAAPPGVQTPQGIGVGSTLAAVRAAYPDLIEGQGGPKVAVPGNPAAFYAFVYDRSTRIIVGMDLVTAGPQSCYG